ncbi:MAG: NADH-quinone oxidoreductase subunit J [Cytophagaceae bacterium]
MMLSKILLYVFALITTFFAIYIVFTKNVLYAAFALLGTLIGVSALYVFAGADFIALTQIIIYVGGTLVLIMFGIMLSNRVSGDKNIISPFKNQFLGVLAGITIFVVLFLGILRANFAAVSAEWGKGSIDGTTIPQIGKNLMTTYILPFEIVAMLLLVALIGAVYIASGKIKKS